MSMNHIVCVCVCVFFALVIRYANRIQYALCYISICGLSGCTMLFHIMSQMARFSGKMLSNLKCVF
jgi:hypothetical protein